MAKTNSSKSAENKKSIFDFFRFGESYSSLILGMVVVIILTILLLSFVRGNNQIGADQNNEGVAQRIANFFQMDRNNGDTNEDDNADEDAANKSEDAYKVAAGDSLWTISEKEYGNGYNWIEIARVNNLSNPDAIETGMDLKLPEVEPNRVATSGESNKEIDSVEKDSENKITVESYQINENDTLWDIAVRAYGDGYKWVEIARVNNLPNPDLIYTGNTLKLPRS